MCSISQGLADVSLNPFSSCSTMFCLQFWSSAYFIIELTHNFKILPDQYPGQKIYYPKEKTWNLHPWFWKKDVSYPHSNVLKAELFIFVKIIFAILALIHRSMAYII